jgi:hypothetical protein
MAAKKNTGIVPTMVKFGGGIAAVRALPRAKGKRPAVIILHERYGIDQHTKDLTAKLAQAGFVGFAPDLFHRFTGDRKAVLKGEQRVDLTDDGAYDGRRVDLPAPCFLIRHPDGDLMWESGVSRTRTDLEVDVHDGVHAAEAHRDPGRPKDWCHRSVVPWELWGGKAPPPLADDLARRVETSSDDVIGQALACQEHNLGPDDIAIR